MQPETAEASSLLLLLCAKQTPFCDPRAEFGGSSLSAPAASWQDAAGQSMIGIGTLLNAAGIVIGGLLGLALRRQLSHHVQVGLKGALGVLVIFIGLKTTWTSLGGGLGTVVKQVTIVVLALTLGRLTGRLLHLQKGLNRLGQYAKERFSKAGPDQPHRWSEGFITCTILYCVGPMAILGSVQDGLDGKWQTLGAKALMDGLATMAFVGMFGWGAILSVVPVVAYQGSITLAARFAAPWLNDPVLMNSVNATGGLLVFCIALIILELKKIELADYLPSLVWAPLITWVWR
jgi:uncharacterized membrane protein YqgA involved in biofilm formation